MQYIQRLHTSPLPATDFSRLLFKCTSCFGDVWHTPACRRLLDDLHARHFVRQHGRHPQSSPGLFFSNIIFSLEIQILSRLIPPILIGCLRETLNGGKCLCSPLVFSHLRRSLDNLYMFGSVSASGGGETGLVLVVDKCFRGSKDSTSPSKGFPFLTLSPPTRSLRPSSVAEDNGPRSALTSLRAQAAFSVRLRTYFRKKYVLSNLLIGISHLLSLFFGCYGRGSACVSQWKWKSLWQFQRFVKVFRMFLNDVRECAECVSSLNSFDLHFF